MFCILNYCKLINYFSTSVFFLHLEFICKMYCYQEDIQIKNENKMN